ncbi:MAG: filamentous hemagglutinin N-terminal domain-containing protein, partial [Cyanothece sp. SIO2G6]|nr:filamentous hemagglutinin N-terminal domain-containing protein [Cyanothece sp. SIO2G6]
INEANLEVGGDLTLAAGTVTNIGNLTAGGQVQVTETVPAQPQEIPSDPAIDTSDRGVQILSGPDDPFEISLMVPAATGIQPDDTLGAERSVLVEDVEVRGALGDRLDGGAIRGTNLFHSFTAFNIEEGDRAYFSNPIGVETILSRVTGMGRSDIMGTLGVDGGADLFMINPNGLIFGPNARLDLDGSFLASTANRFTFGEGVEFSANEPNVAPDVVVSSDIGVQLVEGGTATLTNEANLALNPAETLTLSGNTVMNSGSITVPGGQVEVLGDRVALIDDAVIDVSGESGGGTALVGGNYQGEGPQHNALRTYVGPNATINADAVTSGDGGNVIVWADDITRFYGDISAQGGSVAGDGGFVEVSGLQNLVFQGNVNLNTVDGTIGTLLLDPVNITIANGNGGTDDAQLDPGTPDAGDLEGQIFADEGPDETTISENKLEGLNGDANVILQASGNITLEDLADDALTFTAGNGTIEFNAGGTFEMEDVGAGDDTPDQIVTNGRNIFISGNSITLGVLDAGNGDIDLTANQINLNADVTADDQIYNGAVLTDDNNITLTADGIDFVNSVSGTGILTLQPSVAGRDITIGGTINNTNNVLELTQTDVNALQDGFERITIGRDDGTGRITLAGNLTFNDPVELRSPNGTNNNNRITTNGVIQFTAPELDIDSSRDIALDNAVLNIAGTTTLSSGRDIDLNNPNNNFVGDVVINAARDVTLSDVDSVNLGNASFRRNYTVTATDNISINGATISGTNANSSISLTSTEGTIEIENNSTVSALAAATGSGIEIVASEGNINIDRSTIETTGSAGDSGNITISAAQGTVSLTDTTDDSTQIIARGRGTGLLIAGGTSVTTDLSNAASLLSVVPPNNNQETLTIESRRINGSGNNLRIEAPNTTISLPDGATNDLIFDSLQLSSNGDVRITSANGLLLEDSSIQSDDLTVTATGNIVALVGPSQNPLLDANDGVLTVTSETGRIFLIADSSVTPVTLRSTAQEGTVNAPNTPPELPGIYTNGDWMPEKVRIGEGTGLTAYSAVISANGDVSLDSYTGSALKIEATGSITTGDIDIIGSATFANLELVPLLEGLTIQIPVPISETGLSQLSMDDPDIDTLASSSALILQAGVNGREIGDLSVDFELPAIQGTTQNTTFANTEFSNTAPATVGNITINGSLDTSAAPASADNNGGPIILDASGNIQITGNINTNADGDGGNGGDVDISADGIVTLTGSVITTRGTGANNRSGNVSIRSGSTSTIAPAIALTDVTIDPIAGDAGVTGDITVNADSGGLIRLEGTRTGDNQARLFTDTPSSGNPPSIPGDGQTGGDLSITSNGGDVEIVNYALDASVNANSVGNGGSITIRGSNVVISENSSIATTVDGGAAGAVNNQGDGGDILIEGDRVTLGSPDLNNDGIPDTAVDGSVVQSAVANGGVGEGGDITVRGVNGAVATEIALRNGDISAANSATGSAGTVDFSAAEIDLNNARISTANQEFIRPDGEIDGNIRFQNVNNFMATNSLITASTVSGTAGDITIASAGDNASVTLSGNAADGDREGIFVESATGEAGNISIDTGTLSVNNTAEISSSSTDGNAGLININATGGLTMNNGASIGVSSTGAEATDSAGNITINAPDVTINSNSQIVAQTNAGGTLANRANINLNGLETLTVNNGLISSSTQTGVAGDVIVDASESITLDGQITVPPSAGENLPQRGIEVQALGDGGIAGNIELTTPLLTVANGAQISASTNSQTATVGVNDSNEPNIPPTIPAGDITINSANVNLSTTDADIATGIISGTTGADNAGRIILQPDNLDDTLAVTFEGGAEISASTTGSGEGGDIILNGEAEPDIITEPDGTTRRIYRGAISLSGEGRVEASAAAGATGNAGELRINTQQFSLGTGVQILADSVTSNGGSVLFQTVDDFVLRNARISVSSESGQPGGIIIQARNSALISGTLDVDNDGNLDPAGLFATNASANELGQTSSGFLTLSTPTLIVENGANVETSTESGIGGTVSVNAQSVILRDSVEDGISTGLFSRSTTGTSGGVQLFQVETLTIQGDSQISTETENGVAGGIAIVREEDVPVGSILIEGTGSAISAAATGAGGRAEDLTLSVADLDVLNGGQISTSNVASTAGGNIAINDVETLTIAGGQIAASTEQGNAGNVTLNATTAVNVSGQLASGEAAGVLAAASQGGNAGSVTITTPSLMVTDNGAVTVSSANGVGVAGNITVNAATVTVADGGEISAETDAGGSSSPANISLRDVQQLTIDRGLISSSTQSGTAGQVEVNATQVTITNDGGIESSSTDGNAGSITVTGGDRIIVNNGLLASSTDNGEAGNITLEADSLIQLQGTGADSANGTEVGVQATARAGGNAGAIAVTTDQLTIADGAAIAVSSEQGNGLAGSITVAARAVDLTNNAAISAETDRGGLVNPANIRLTDLETLQVIDSRISSATAAGVAGNVQVGTSENPASSVLLQGTFAATPDTTVPAGLQAIATQGGNAGTIDLNTNTLTIVDGAAVAVSSEEGSGTAGNININATTVSLDDGAIAAETDAGGAGNPANINLNGLTDLTINSGTISSATDEGVAGSVTVDSDRVFIDNGLISSSAAAGTAGSITVTDATLVQLQNTAIGDERQETVGIQAIATQGGNAGEITVTTDRLNIADNAAVAVNSDNGDGTAGNININAAIVSLSDDGAIAAETDAGGEGSPANIRLNEVQRLTVDSGQISSSTQSGEAGQVVVDANRVVVSNSGQISSSSIDGTAGSVEVVDGDRLTVDSGLISSSTESGTAGQVEVNATQVTITNDGGIESSSTDGDAGRIRVTGGDRIVVNNGRIESSTENGSAGSIILAADALIRLRGSSENATIGDVGVQATASSGGNAGAIRVTTDQLTLSNGAAIAVSSERGAGFAGNINIDARNVNLRDNAAISAETDAGGTEENSANIRLTGLDTLQVIDSRISSATADGVAGSVRINTRENPADSVRLRGTFTTVSSNGTPRTVPGGLAAIAERGGDAGQIQVNTDELTITDRAAIAVSSERDGLAGDITINANQITLNNRATISAETDAGGADSPANIRLTNVDTLNISNNSEISASTETGTAGDIRINIGEAAAESIIVSDGSRIAVEASGDDEIPLGEGGIAGNLRLNTEDLIVRRDSELSVSSPRGQAGNLIIDASFVNLDNGRLTAETGGGSGDGANIFITVRSDSDRSTNFLRLENESLISATAFGDADGGNITINSDFIFAFFPTGAEGSDIIANAAQGDGGVVDITALGIFGIQFREQATPLNDITATSQGGGAGVVALTTPGIDPIRGFSSLRNTFADLSDLVGQNCAANLAARGDRISRFTLTGQGGVPSAPTDTLGMIPDPADWVTLEDESVTVSTRFLPEFTLPQFVNPSTFLAPSAVLCYFTRTNS